MSEGRRRSRPEMRAGLPPQGGRGRMPLWCGWGSETGLGAGSHSDSFNRPWRRGGGYGTGRYGRRGVGSEVEPSGTDDTDEYWDPMGG